MRSLVTVTLPLYFSDETDRCILAEDCDDWTDWRTARKQGKVFLQHRTSGCNIFLPSFAYKTLTAARELVEEAAAAGQYISLLQPVHPSLREARPGQYKLNPTEILALILMSNKSSPGIQPYFTQTWGNVQIKPEEIYLPPALCTFCGSSSGITKANPTFRNKLTKPLVGTEDNYFLM